MPAYTVFVTAAFANATRRNRVANRASTLAAENGFTPTTRVAGYPAGTVPFTFTATATGDGMTAGNTYPAVTIAYEHTDQEAVAQAEHLIQAEMESQSLLYGTYGTWTDISG